MLEIKKSYIEKEVITYELIEVCEAKCDRCNHINKIESIPQNTRKVLINKVTLSSVNIQNELMPEHDGNDWHICDDCWNELLDFFTEKE